MIWNLNSVYLAPSLIHADVLTCNRAQTRRNDLRDLSDSLDHVALLVSSQSMSLTCLIVARTRGIVRMTCPLFLILIDHQLLEFGRAQPFTQNAWQVAGFMVTLPYATGFMY